MRDVLGENTLAAGYVYGSSELYLILVQTAVCKLCGPTILNTYSGAHLR